MATPNGGGVTTIPGIAITDPGWPGGGTHGETLPGPGDSCSGGLAWPGRADATVPGAWSLAGIADGDGSPAGGASAGACARLGDAPNAATATATTMIHAADAATPIRPARRPGPAPTWTGAANAIGVASGSQRAAPGAWIPLSICTAPNVRVRRGRAVATFGSARRSAYGSAAGLVSPRAGPEAMTTRS